MVMMKVAMRKREVFIVHVCGNFPIDTGIKNTACCFPRSGLQCFCATHNM